MRNSVLAKIKSAPKLLLASTLLALVLLLAAGIVLLRPKGADYVLHAHARTYNLQAAVTDAEQEQGLGGRQRLEPTEGMIFTYTDTAQRCFWMKDMRFPLDIIWVSSSQHVVHIEEHVHPNSYPKTFCAEGQYVIELASGEVARSGLRIGHPVAF